MRLRDRRVQVAHPVRLTCQAVGWPMPTICWYKDGVELVSDAQHTIWTEGQFNTLELGRTQLDDSGTYTVTAKNPLGAVSCHCTLVVDKGLRAYIAPEFYGLFDSVYLVREGEEIRIYGQIEAYPTVGVTWQRDGVRLRSSRRIAASLDHDGFVELVIAGATAWDAGLYNCVATNAVGRVECSCRVIVEPIEDGGQTSRRDGDDVSSMIP